VNADFNAEKYAPVYKKLMDNLERLSVHPVLSETITQLRKDIFTRGQ
jgi:hypothetical protein